VQAYARPHELQILTDESAQGLSATVERVLSFGASARVELVGPDGQPLEAELTRDQAEELQLRGGQRVKLSAAKLSLLEAGAGI
jgi:sulfate/thiosulfate transport system ATP-binding protein